MFATKSDVMNLRHLASLEVGVSYNRKNHISRNHILMVSYFHKEKIGFSYKQHSNLEWAGSSHLLLIAYATRRYFVS